MDFLVAIITTLSISMNVIGGQFYLDGNNFK